MVEIRIKTDGEEDSCASLGSNMADVLGSTASRAKEKVRHAEFQFYVNGRQKALFDTVNAAYKEVCKELNKSIDAEDLKINKPDFTDDYKASSPATQAEYHPDSHAIEFYKPSYKVFVEILEAEDASDKARNCYDLDVIIGHELGHALLDESYFNKDETRYDKRKSESLAELIGHYSAQILKGEHATNKILADKILQNLREDLENVIDFCDEVSSNLSRAVKQYGSEELEVLLLENRKTMQFYVEPELGVVEALRANNDMQLPNFIKILLADPVKLGDGAQKHIVEERTLHGDDILSKCNSLAKYAYAIRQEAISLG